MTSTVDDEWPAVPADGAPALEWLLFRQSQVLTREQAFAAIGRGALQNRLTQGRWQRAGHGVVVAHNGPLTRDQRLWAAVLDAGPDAVCAGLMAATRLGLRGYDRPLVELLVPARRTPRSQPATRVRRSAVLPDDHLMRNAAPPSVTMPRAIVDAAAWARTDDDAQAVVAAAFQQRKVTAGELDAVLGVLPRARRRALVRETIGYAVGGAQSLSEVDFVRLCHRYALPPPDQQVPRVDRAGRTRYLDAYWREWRLHAEVDGAWHTEVRAWWEDMRRQNDLWAAGERVLRFPAWVVARRPGEVAATLRAALEAAGWPS